MSIQPGSVSLQFGEVNTRSYYSPFSFIKDLSIGTYRTIMGVWTIVNYKWFGGSLFEQIPTIQGYCEKTAFYCGYNPTYPHITEMHLPGMPFSWKEVYGGVSVPVLKFPCTTIHVTTGTELNKIILKEHRNSNFGGGSLSYDAAFDLLQKIFPDVSFSKEDFLLTCSDKFTDYMHRPILDSIKSERLDPCLERECNELISRWKGYSEAFDLSLEMRYLTSAIITGTVFGNSKDYVKLSNAVHFMNVYLIKQVLGGFTEEDKTRFETSCKDFRETILEILKDENAELSPLFSKELTHPQKIAACLGVFFAGQATTSFALTHNFAELALNQELQKDLCDGNEANIKAFNHEQLLKLPPVAGVSRRLEDLDAVISYQNEKGIKVGKLLRAGDRITPHFTTTANQVNNIHDALIFGSGANQCIGKQMALKEISKVMARVLTEFELVTEEDQFKYQIQATKEAEPFFIKVIGRDHGTK